MWCPPAAPMTSPRPATPSSAVGMPDRHADESGGPPTGGIARTLARFYAYVTQTREGVNGYEDQIQHERMPWYHQGYVGSNGNAWVDWTRSGPIRPSLHMLQQTVRRQQGSSATRNFDPHPVSTLGIQDQGHGMHTNPPQSKVGVNARRANRAQQTAARVNRLSPSIYSGQSYSQTTAIQGGGVRPR